LRGGKRERGGYLLLKRKRAKEAPGAALTLEHLMTGSSGGGDESAEDAGESMGGRMMGARVRGGENGGKFPWMKSLRGLGGCFGGSEMRAFEPPCSF
jgi:hypothetical protein